MNTPEFEGWELEYLGQSTSNNSTDPTGCEHPNAQLTTYTEDGLRYCGCRECGSVWGMEEKLS